VPVAIVKRLVICGVRRRRRDHGERERNGGQCFHLLHSFFDTEAQRGRHLRVPTSLDSLSGLHGAITEALRLQLGATAALAFGFFFADLIAASLLDALAVLAVLAGRAVGRDGQHQHRNGSE
jgi:hypothetical protein